MDIVAIARVALENDLRRAESISQNVANVSTPGYKRQVAVVNPFELQMASALGRQGLTAGTGGASTTRTVIDAAAGAARFSGNSQDVMIEGASFFEVATPDGLAYTRQGNLRTDAAGRLVTGADWPVMGEGGGEITLGPGAFTITANGEVRQQDRLVGKLKLVRFTDAAALEPNGGGTYRAGRAVVDNGRNADTLRIGFVEGSNVSTPQEMVRLTETVRHYEAMHKIVQGYDEAMEKAIRKLGEF